MQSDIKSLLKEIEPIEELYARMKQGGAGNFGPIVFSQFETLCISCVNRLTGSASIYAQQVQEAKKLKSPYDDRGRLPVRIEPIYGVIQALKLDITNGCMSTLQERVHADMFADFLEAAEYLLHESFKDPAAVMIGGVLEEHLRQLCRKNGLPTEAPDTKNTAKMVPKKASALNNDLRAAQVYGLTELQQVTAWLVIRNDAAHADYNKYDQKQVETFLTGVRDFTAKYPA